MKAIPCIRPRYRNKKAVKATGMKIRATTAMNDMFPIRISHSLFKYCCVGSLLSFFLRS